MLRKILIFGFVVALLVVGAGLYLRSTLFSSNINDNLETYEMYIPSGSNYDYVSNKLDEDQVLKHHSTFALASKLMKYQKEIVPSGRYILRKGMSNREIITKLRAGKQDAVKVTFNNVRTMADLCGQIAVNLEVDSNQLYNVVMSPDFLDEKGMNTRNVMSLFIPNTYEVYWDAEPRTVIDRLVKEHSKFWAANGRAEKLAALGMTKEEVYALASIVEKETNLKSERETLAAVYLNRIRQGILLQADPTVVFATGDFELRRVLKKHLEMDSPYNTYKNLGVPPGPIFMPSINSIDAVLANEQHDYIFFCAKPGYNSGHLFAKTNAQHEVNARTYHKWLHSQNIR